MNSAPQIWTADDLWQINDSSCRIELVRGELRRYEFNGVGHGMITARLAAVLFEIIRARSLGEVLMAGTGFLIARDPDTVRAPDIAFLARDRIPATGCPEGFCASAPDLAVETMSPSDTVFEADEKVREWLAAGTRLVWALNPRQQTVSIFRPDNTARILTISETLDGEDVVPGFQIPLAKLFR
jgi:Uma2 family endonuclease